MPKITPESVEIFGLASAQELYDRTPPEQRNEYARGYLAATKDILTALETPTSRSAGL